MEKSNLEAAKETVGHIIDGVFDLRWELDELATEGRLPPDTVNAAMQLEHASLRLQTALETADGESTTVHPQSEGDGLSMGSKKRRRLFEEALRDDPSMTPEKRRKLIEKALEDLGRRVDQLEARIRSSSEFPVEIADPPLAAKGGKARSRKRPSRRKVA